MNRRDVRVIERGKDFRFALEAGDAIRIRREQFGQDLQRYVASELRVPSTIDFAHPAGAEGGEDFVRADARTNGE